MTSMKKGLLQLALGLAVNQAAALSAIDSSASLARGRVFEALSSPSGKLTISPEIVIPEPSDPTAILLQTNAVTTLSERIRNSKANAAWISGGSQSALKTFCGEQEQARGNFPGPLPVIYCCTSGSNHNDAALDPQVLADAGASGVVIPVLAADGSELESLDQISDNSDWVSKCNKAIDCGVAPIPEVILGDALARNMQEEEVEKLVQALSTDGQDPVAVLLTINPAANNDDDDNEEEQEEQLVAVPKVLKALGKKVPILGSIRVTAGENRLGMESQRFKEAGFTGVVLRSDCVPGFRLNPDLEIVGQFWSACIGDLKSTRSKSFQFNSRNNMEKSMSLEWAKYQNNVIESGALGDPNDAYSIVDEAAGEYRGFA